MTGYKCTNENQSPVVMATADDNVTALIVSLGGPASRDSREGNDDEVIISAFSVSLLAALPLVELPTCGSPICRSASLSTSIAFAIASPRTRSSFSGMLGPLFSADVP